MNISELPWKSNNFLLGVVFIFFGPLLIVAPYIEEYPKKDDLEVFHGDRVTLEKHTRRKASDTYILKVSNSEKTISVNFGDCYPYQSQITEYAETALFYQPLGKASFLVDGRAYQLLQDQEPICTYDGAKRHSLKVGRRITYLGIAMIFLGPTITYFSAKRHNQSKHSDGENAAGV